MGSDASVIRSFRSREKWLRARRATIGGSDAPIVAGVSPYSSPRELWAIKSGLVEPKPANQAMQMGIALEPVIAELVAREKGWHFVRRRGYTVHRHPRHDWATCTLDREIVPMDDRGPGDLQIKNVHAFAADAWQDRPPLHVEVQVQHELFVTGFAWGAVAAFLGGNDLRIYPVERNDRFIAALATQEERFVACLRSATPPEIDGSEATAEVLKKLHPFDNGQTIELPAEFHELDQRLCELKAAIKGLEDEERLLKNRILDAIGDATYGVLPAGGRYQRKWIEKHLPAREASVSRYPELRRLKR